jgi:4-hydroxy-tetrahydrodipicolinate reductase
LASVSNSVKTKNISLIVAGINGRMGKATAAAIHRDDSIKLVGAFGRSGAKYTGKSISELGITNNNGKDVRVSNDLDSCLAELSSKPDVLIDFTEAKSAVKHSIAALEKGIRPVIGTSGLTEEHLKELRRVSSNAKIGVLIVPNFSVGAVLLISFAKQAVKFFKSAEIVETHKLGKLDAPSGTAMYTARVMGEEGAKIKQIFNENPVTETELVAGVRGGRLDSGIHVHSLRLPGILSKQDVYFAGEGELLTLRHESHNTKCFEQGIVLAIKSASELNSFVLGLESIIEQFTEQ